ncbi:MAG: hypothetical protein R3E31_11545 [Chloroflexota bacterium]
MMSDETPSVEEIKERLKVEIPVDEEAAKAEEKKADVVEELKGLGRQFAETLQSAWNSEERQKIESEIREGVQSFVGEVDKVIREARESDVATKVKSEAAKVKTRVETGEFSKKARDGFVQGLQWLSEELGKLAEQFNPKEKEPPADSMPDDSAE